MKLLDKGKPRSCEYCEFCRKEIKPGEKMIMSTINPYNNRQVFNRFYEPSFYSYADNIPKYHEKCFIAYIKKTKKI